MAYKTIANLRDSTSGMLQGLNLNNVTNLNVLFERTVRSLLVELDIPEAVIKSNFILYDGVIDYAAPSNIFASGMIDIRPQGVSRNFGDIVEKQPVEQFDREKAWITQGYKTTVEYDSGTGTLRIVSGIPSPRAILDSMTDDVGWTAAGSASGLVEDATVYWQAPASLRFNLTGASVGTLTKSVPSQDLTAYQGIGVAFLALYVPSTVANLTSITLRIGSDASNYYEVTVTTGFIEAFKANKWQLIAFDLAGATTTGSPTITAMDYVQVRVTHGASIANVHVGDLWIALPSPTTLIYETDAIFLNTTISQAPSNTITNNDDQILLNNAAYAIYEKKCAIEIAMQQGGRFGSGLIADIRVELYGDGGRMLGLIPTYRGDNPSAELRTVGNYYEGIQG
jgi:hypothetical protein